jgi:hypothetical protein
VTNTGAAGFLTLFPDDSSEIPLAADLTWSAHQTIGNLGVANLGSTATMDFFNGSTGSTDVVIDADGFYRATVPPAATARAAGHAPLTGKRTAKRLSIS